MPAILQKRTKKDKIFENFGKNAQILKCFEKGQHHASNYWMDETARIF